jgi:uncharacterized protein
MNKLKISLKDLRARPGQKLHLSFHASVQEPILEDPVQADVSLAANSASIRLTGKIQATARLSCHHCLTSFVYPMEIDLDEEFVYEDYLNVKTHKVKERELQKEDFFETIPYDGIIDVFDTVYQAIVLAIPSHCICGPNCTGPPVYKGSNHSQVQKSGTSAEGSSSIDPRWHNLKTIFSNDTQNEKVRDNTL